MTKSHADAMNTGVLMLLCLPAAIGRPAATAFTYQGRLTHLGQPVNSTADFQFRLYDSASDGNQVGALVAAHGVNVGGGLFSATLDFGIDPRVANESRWLEIDVRSPAGIGSYITLAPRQPLTPAPLSLNTRGIAVDAAGRVGIGTTSPTESLDVFGRVKTGDFITTGPWVEVRAYGAAGDDNIDDTGAIQAAIDSLGEASTMRGGTVFFAPGRYLISDTLTIDRRCGLFYGLGPGGPAGTSGSILKWQGPAGVPMVRVTRCWFTRLHGLRFVGNSASRPSAAIDMAAAADHSPVNTQLSLSWIWVGHFGGFDPDGTPGFEDGITTSGANLQDDQSQMDHVFVQGVAGSCIRLANTQNVLWRLSNVVLNGEGEASTGITCGTRHAILVNPNFGSNRNTDIEITNDGMIDVYNMGSEGSGRLALAAGGAQLRVRGGYWQASGATNPDGNVIDISGGTSVVRMEDFLFTQFGGPAVKCKMRGPMAVAIFSNVALPSAPDSFFDLATEHPGERRRIEFLGGSSLADSGSFVNEWSHEEISIDRHRNDFTGLTRLRQAAGYGPILEVWNSDLTSRLFGVDAEGRVGVGTTSPAWKLHVAGGVHDGIKVSVPDGANTSAQVVLSAGSEPQYGQGAIFQLNAPSTSPDPNALFLLNRTPGPLVLGTNNQRMMDILPSGRVGIGTTDPWAALHAVTDDWRSVIGETSSSVDLAAGVMGNASSTENNITFGGIFNSDSTAGVGVYGVTSAVVGGTWGGRFETNSPDGYGVVVHSNAFTGKGSGGFFDTMSPHGNAVIGFCGATSGNAIGGWFETLGPDGIGVAGRNRATAGPAHGGKFETHSPVGEAVLAVANAPTGGANAVHGHTDSPGGTGLWGAAASGTGVNWGVYGQTSSPDGFGGYFDGKVHVTKNLTVAGAKSFKIDHPLDPANKYLLHAAVESPEMKNVYDGVAVTDDRGLATIELPEWFEALNRDFRYQLTVIDDGSDGGEWVMARVARKIKDNRFTIRTSAPRVEVSWQVTGVRNDAWARANPLAVEQDKPESQRGLYAAPSAHGQPEEKSLDHARRTAALRQVAELADRNLPELRRVDMDRIARHLGRPGASSAPAPETAEGK